MVDAVGPSNSIIHGLDAVRHGHRLSLTRPLRSIARAIEEENPDLVIPSDDPSRQALNRLYDLADPTTRRGAVTRAYLARSLGPPETYDEIYSRSALMEIAARRGLCAPRMTEVARLDDAVAWQERLGGLAVMKTDGSWGGRDVEIVAGADEVAAWHRLSRPPSAVRILKRLVLDHSPWPLRDRLTGRRPVVSIQAYVAGRPANVAVACLDGEVLAAVTAEVVVSTRPTGPATVLRVMDNPEMTETAASLVKALRLTGLCGFDFVIEAETGRAHLVELYTRATPTAHLLTVDGADPLRSLAAALRRQGATTPDTVCRRPGRAVPPRGPARPGQRVPRHGSPRRPGERPGLRRAGWGGPTHCAPSLSSAVRRSRPARPSAEVTVLPR